MKDIVRFVLFYILSLIIYNSIMLLLGRNLNLVDGLLLPLIVTIIIFLGFKPKKEQ